MSALTSLIHLSTVNWIDMFFVAVSEEEPFISHAKALVDALLDSNPEKQCFRALVELARAATLLYYRHEVPDGFAHDIRTRLVRLLHAYRYVLPSFSAQERRDDIHHRSGEQNILTALTNTYSLLASNVSSLPFYRDHNQIEYAYATESAYFLLIFSSHLLDKHLHINHNPYLSQRGLYATLSLTLVLWLRQVIQYIRFHIFVLQLCNAVPHPQLSSLYNALQ